jgi:hypothetical protein
VVVGISARSRVAAGSVGPPAAGTGPAAAVPFLRLGDRLVAFLGAEPVIQRLINTGLPVQVGPPGGQVGRRLLGRGAGAVRLLLPLDGLGLGVLAVLGRVRRDLGGRVGGLQCVPRVGGHPVQRTHLVEQLIGGSSGQQRRQRVKPGSAEAGVHEAIDPVLMLGERRSGLLGRRRRRTCLGPGLVHRFRGGHRPGGCLIQRCLSLQHLFVENGTVPRSGQPLPLGLLRGCGWPGRRIRLGAGR